MKTPETQLCKIWWILDGIVKEEIRKDRPVPYGIAKWYVSQMKVSTHKTGTLKIVDATAKPQDYYPRLNF
jgi:hypothetical protein